MMNDNVNFFITANAKYFPSEKLMIIKERLENADDSKMMMINAVDYKDPTTLLLVSIFLGTLGIDRFMIGDIGMGILKLLTAGLCGILTIIDWFTIQGKTKELNFNEFLKVS